MISAILISLKKCWSDKIYTGEKTIEIRKTQPFKDKPAEMPFRCYIYESKTSFGTGMVTGYFNCKSVIVTTRYEELVEGSCLSLTELTRYAKGKKLCGLVIGKVVKFAEPQPVSYFGINRPPQSWQYIYQNKSNELLCDAIKKYNIKNTDGMTRLQLTDVIQGREE